MDLEVVLVGETPLMMHNPRLADPLDEIAAQMKEITSKRKKTTADHHDIAHLEFIGGIYWTEELGPYIPSHAILRCFNEGAKVSRNGRNVNRAVRIKGTEIPLEYDGPRELDILAKDVSFQDRRSVGVQSARTMRTRPIFRGWSLRFHVNLNESILNLSEFMRILEDAGSLEGLMEARILGYGRFNAKVKPI